MHNTIGLPLQIIWFYLRALELGSARTWLCSSQFCVLIIKHIL